MRLYLIRHAGVTMRREQPSAQWHLSPEGRDAAHALAEELYWAEVAAVYASSEPKAIATAQPIAARHKLSLRIDSDLCEVQRPWVEGDYADAVRRYFAGETLEGWEQRAAAIARVRRAIGGIALGNEDIAAASHGLALTLYVGDLLDLNASDSYELWRSIRFPDVAIVDPQARRLEKAFGG